MDSKYCSTCLQRYPLSSFCLDASDPTSKVLATCLRCRERRAVWKTKRKALGQLDPNIPTKKHLIQPENLSTGPKLSTLPPDRRLIQPESSIRVSLPPSIPPRPEPSIRAPISPPIPPRPEPSIRAPISPPIPP